MAAAGGGCSPLACLLKYDINVVTSKIMVEKLYHKNLPICLEMMCLLRVGVSLAFEVLSTEIFVQAR